MCGGKERGGGEGKVGVRDGSRTALSQDILSRSGRASTASPFAWPLLLGFRSEVREAGDTGSNKGRARLNRRRGEVGRAKSCGIK